MNRLSSWLIVLVLCLGAVALCATTAEAQGERRFAVVLVTPTYPQIASRVMPRLTPRAVPPSTPPASPPGTPQTAPPGGPVGISVTTGQTIPSLSLEQAQRQLSFQLRLPAWLPAEFDLAPKYVSVSRRGPGGLSPEVWLSFSGPTGVGSPLVFVKESVGPPESWYPVAEAEALEPLVHGQTAVAALGDWDRRYGVVHGARDVIPSAGGLWDPNADAGLISWESDGVTFLVRVINLRPTVDDLVQIAESFEVPE